MPCRRRCALVAVLGFAAACGGDNPAGDDGPDAAPITTCSDGLDNDSDGLIDFPNDPGCLAPNQDSGEDDDCPSGPGCPECGNGIDDDLDGLIDFAGGDPGCAAAGDPDEFNFDGQACGAGTSVSLLPASGTVAGTILAGASHLTATCGGGAPTGNGPEVAYVIDVDRASTLVATTDFPGTVFDTVLYLRRTCTDPGTQLACNDDLGGTNTRSTLTVALQPGTYFLVVDGKTPDSIGPYVLIANLYVSQGEACSGPEECAPGFVCRQVPGASGNTCERPVCSDTRDDDNDGLTDYPLDPGCTSPDDTSEVDSCPGAGCPQCGNGVDDDSDGQTDYPDDISCVSASGTSEEDCPIETDPVLVVVGGSSNSTTAGFGDQFALSCGFDAGDPDRVHMLYVRAPLATLTMDTGGSSFDTVLGFFDGLCAAELDCDDEAGPTSGSSRITRTGVAPGTYAIVVDGFFDEGPYNLNVRGTYSAGQPCDPTMPMFTCANGYACTGTFPAATCQPAACNDSMDADGDGFPGYPTDPGCASSNDGDESDDCPSGPNCPECGNEADDDGDGQIDYPDDPGCTSAAGASEQCVSADPVRDLTTASVTNQSTAGLADDFDPSCGLGNGADEVWRLVIDFPIDEIRVNTVGSSLDAIVAIKSPNCSTFDLQCDDAGSGIFLIDPQLGEYYIIVDDRNLAGSYNLHVSGHYLDNGRCNPTNVFPCNTGFSCTGTAGMETCAPAACNDTTDADGDGFPGYPTDPGCTSVSDGDETDTCPSGPGCPACGNDLDDDGDGFIDYPADPACASASENNELAPCVSVDPVPVFTANVTGASTAGHLNDVTPSCGLNGRDDIYRLFVTQPLVSLTVDTLGSDINTVLSVRRASCNSADLGCAAGNAGNGDSEVVLSNVTAGEYFLIVEDQFTSSPTTYNLHVSGVLAAGNRCEPASATFVCTTGHVCDGPAGAETCIAGPCNDTVDADGDGDPGYPSDPGCTGIADLSEADDCPSGPMCPMCANGLDDDGDARVDWPMDMGCSAASDTSEIDCVVESDPLLTITAPTTSGTLVGATDDLEPTCQNTDSSDRVYLLTLPVPVTALVVDTENSQIFDTVLMVTDSTCGTQLTCDDDAGNGNWSVVTLNNLAAGTYGIVADAFDGETGGFMLNVRGTVAAGQPCTSPLFASGVLACAGTCTAGMCQ